MVTESGMPCEMNCCWLMWRYVDRNATRIMHKREGMYVMERKNVVTLDLRLVMLQQIWDKKYNKSI